MVLYPRALTCMHALIFEDALSFRKQVHAFIFKHINKFKKIQVL